MLRVVIVDDNRDIVLTTIELLRAYGHEATGCYNGDEVFACAREFAPDVVILDIGLPGKSGWEVAQQIRSRLPGKQPLLIAMSGEFTKRADKMLAEMYGFDHYLVKPFDPQALMAILENIGAGK